MVRDVETDVHDGGTASPAFWEGGNEGTGALM